VDENTKPKLQKTAKIFSASKYWLVIGKLEGFLCKAVVIKVLLCGFLSIARGDETSMIY